MRLIKIFVWVVVVFMFSCCGNVDADLNDKLDRVEALIDEMPDWAMAILKNIDGDAIDAESQKARYALYYSNALKRTIFRKPMIP